MDRLTLDLRSAWRMLWTRRGSTAAIVALLGMGVGFAATMFALADPFVVRPLPYPSPHQLVVIRGQRASSGSLPSWGARAALPTVRDWRARDDLFQGLATFGLGPRPLRAQHNGGTVRIGAIPMGRDALRMLGHAEPGCESSASTRCLLLTPAAWHRYYGSQPNAIGTTLSVSQGAPLRIGGVLPSTFVLPYLYYSYAPPADGILLATSLDDDASIEFVSLLARSQPGIAPAAIQSALQATVPNTVNWTVTVQPLSAVLTRVNRATALGALAAALLILIVCAASATNLLFSRGFHRSVELATRRALGASATDLRRLALAELTLLAVLVCSVSVGLVSMSLVMLRRIMPQQYAVLGQPVISTRIVIGVVVMSAITLGLSAALAATALRSHTRGALAGHTGGTRAGRPLRFCIVATQTALAMILTTGTVLLGRSYLNLFGQDTGFSSRSTIVSASYPGTPLTSAELRQQIESAVDRLQRLPGVERAGATTAAGGFLDGAMRGAGAGSIVISGVAFSGPAKRVTPGFLAAAGTRLIAGRMLSAEDTNGSGWLVNESFVRTLRSGRPTVGESVTTGIGDAMQVGTVVGVVQDLFDTSLDARPGPAIYRLLDEPTPDAGGDTPVRYMVRTHQAAGDISPAIAQAVRRDAPDVAVTDVSTVGSRLQRTVAERVFSTLVMSLFAMTAVVVCATGLVGVVAFVTARRTRELAIRIATGARPGHVLYAVSADTLAASAVGLGVGLVTTRFASTLLQRVAYGVELNTWATGLPAAGAMLLLITISVGLTARRALRLPVAATLRQD
jgi:predicted permease